MADIRIIETDPEQGIAEYGHRNIRQYDMRAYYGSILIASLWQDNDEEWHWNKRLYDIGIVENLDITCLDDKSIVGIINEFAVIVQDWLDDEVSYLTDIKNGIDKIVDGMQT